MEYETTVDDDLILSTLDAVKARGISAEIVNKKEAALARVITMVPDGSNLVTAASVTLNEIGFMSELASGNHSWRNLSDEIRQENDPVKRALLRRQSLLADFSLGSVAAITEAGELVIASGSGSQLSPYLSSKNVIWVAGAQKIVPTLDDALRRIREFCAPKVEDMGRKMLGREGAGTIGKILIFENEAEYLGRNVNLILVNEKLGY